MNSFLTCVLVLCVGMAACEAATGVGGEMSGARVSFALPVSAVDGPDFAFRLALTFMSKKAWSGEVSKMQRKIEDWQKDNDGDAGRYLNDRLIIVAMSAAGGEISKIQRGILWLSFYKAFRQPVPTAVAKFFKEHRGSATRLFTNFSWDKAATYIKQKKWREDIQERKKAMRLAKAGMRVPTPVAPIEAIPPKVRAVESKALPATSMPGPAPKGSNDHQGTQIYFEPAAWNSLNPPEPRDIPLTLER